MSRYQDRIAARFARQEAKGLGKYGFPLEDNPAAMAERLEHLAEELSDALMYIEWIKEYIEWGMEQMAEGYKPMEVEE